MIDQFNRSFLVITTAAALVLGTGMASADTLPGTWQAKQARFQFAGFTTRYTCDGLRSKVKLLLRMLGARNDVKIQGGCGGRSFNEPQISHNVVLGFAIPVPAEGQGSPGETFPAEWREIHIRGDGPGNVDRGDCELVEQFRDQVLPLFSPREMKDNSTCTPHQINVGDPSLRVTVLMPAATPRATTTAPEQH